MDIGRHCERCSIKNIVTVIIVLSRCTHYCMGASKIIFKSETIDSGEQDALRQALMLVELLKSEHARVLRENIELQGRMYTSTVSDLQTFLKKNAEVKGDILRNVGFRRMDYEDAFGPQPGGTNAPRKKSSVVTTTEVTTISTSETIISTTSSASTTISTLQQNTETFSDISKSTNSPSTFELTTKDPITKITTTKDTTAKETITKEFTTGQTKQRDARVTTTSLDLLKRGAKKLSLSKKEINEVPHTTVSISSTTSQSPPELSQVASELAKELEIFEPSTVTYHKTAQSLSLLWPASTRIHLAKSTRYSIPLPENHAFCYTNPGNALCRTFI